MALSTSCACRDSLASCGCGNAHNIPSDCSPQSTSNNGCTACGNNGGNLLCCAVGGFLKTACRVLNGLDNTLCGCDNNGRHTDCGCGCQNRARF